MKNTIIVLALVGLFLSVSGPSLANETQEEKAVAETLDRMGQAMVQKDVAALASVLHDDLTWGHSTGATQTKEQLVTELGSAEIYEVFRFSNSRFTFTVRPLSSAALRTSGMARRRRNPCMRATLIA